MCFLQLQGLRINYERRLVLAVDSLELERNTVYSLFGSNMAGKTSLIKFLSGHLPRSDAQFKQLRINGNSITKPSAGNMRMRGIACCHQNDPMFPDLSILENMLLGSPPKNLASGHHRKVVDSIERILQSNPDAKGITIHSPLKSLSGGLHMIIRTHRATEWEFDLLLLDEPTVGLDDTNYKAFFECISRFTNSERSILLVSHYETDHDEIHELALQNGLSYQALSIRENQIERGDSARSEIIRKWSKA